MAAERNRYGLTRDIKPSTKLEVRRRCGNGCVVCGRFPYEYEHFDPEFVDAREHNPNGITLLCPTHHADKTARRISKRAVVDANANPFNETNDARWDVLLGRDGVQTIEMGTVVIEGPGDFSLNKVPIVELRRDDDGFWRFSAALCDEDGRRALRIEDNEVVLKRGAWDAQLEGPRLTIRSAMRRTSLEMTFLPDQRQISIRFNSRMAGGYRLVADDTAVTVWRNDDRLFWLSDLWFGPRTYSNMRYIGFDAPELGTWDDWTAPDPPGTFVAADRRRRQNERRRKR